MVNAKIDEITAPPGAKYDN